MYEIFSVLHYVFLASHLIYQSCNPKNSGFPLKAQLQKKINPYSGYIDNLISHEAKQKLSIVQEKYFYNNIKILEII